MRLPLQIKINGQTLPQEFPVNWVIPEHDPQGSEVCAEPELVTQLGIKPELAEKLVWITHGERQCLAPDSLKGMDFQADTGHSTLLVNLRAYMEYSDVDWDPPARWDNGIPGIILDYNINNQLRHDQESGSEEQSISGNGTLGANTGAWRLRADWQASYDHRDDDENTSTLHDQAGAATTPIAHYRRSGPNLRWAKAISSPMFSTALTISVPASFLTIRCCRRNCAAMRRDRGHCAL